MLYSVFGDAENGFSKTENVAIGRNENKERLLLYLALLLLLLLLMMMSCRYIVADREKSSPHTHDVTGKKQRVEWKNRAKHATFTALCLLNEL